MITKTSLKHPLLRVRLDLAMRAAAWDSRDHTIGVSCVSGITVVHRRPLGGFVFRDAMQRNITATVRTALREIAQCA